MVDGARLRFRVTNRQSRKYPTLGPGGTPNAITGLLGVCRSDLGVFSLSPDLLTLPMDIMVRGSAGRSIPEARAMRLSLRLVRQPARSTDRAAALLLLGVPARTFSCIVCRASPVWGIERLVRPGHHFPAPPCRAPGRLRSWTRALSVKHITRHGSVAMKPTANLCLRRGWQ